MRHFLSGPRASDGSFRDLDAQRWIELLPAGSKVVRRLQRRRAGDIELTPEERDVLAGAGAEITTRTVVGRAIERTRRIANGVAAGFEGFASGMAALAFASLWVPVGIGTALAHLLKSRVHAQRALPSGSCVACGGPLSGDLCSACAAVPCVGSGESRDRVGVVIRRKRRQGLAPVAALVELQRMGVPVALDTMGEQLVGVFDRATAELVVGHLARLGLDADTTLSQRTVYRLHASIIVTIAVSIIAAIAGSAVVPLSGVVLMLVLAGAAGATVSTSHLPYTEQLLLPPADALSRELARILRTSTRHRERLRRLLARVATADVPVDKQAELEHAVRALSAGDTTAIDRIELAFERGPFR